MKTSKMKVEPGICMKTRDDDKMSAGRSNFDGASYSSPLPQLWRFTDLRTKAPNAGANHSNLNGLKSALDELLKTKGQNKRGVDYASSSG
jgi:hypothetical protein